jgi:hypothetical protein
MITYAEKSELKRNSTDERGLGNECFSETKRHFPPRASPDAVMKRVIDGTPVDLETSRRIEERANCITDEIRRTIGVVDDARFQALLNDDDEA